VSGPDALLALVLDELLPAQGELPGAGGMGLAVRVRQDAATVPVLAVALEQALSALPTDFASLPASERVQALSELERDSPRAFVGLLNLAYNAYYTDARVLACVETQTGYSPGAPQPQGYEMAPFDERVLERVRNRPPSWRPA
jgi:hypothetical protein